MKEKTKLIWLKRVLLIKVIFTLFLWGLPALLANAWFMSLFGLKMPEDPSYLRMFGAAVTAFGAAYWFAYLDPLKNRAIVQAGIVDNLLITLVVIYLALIGYLESWFIAASGALTGLFFVAFVVLLPKEREGG